jgi:hypothetical protein
MASAAAKGPEAAEERDRTANGETPGPVTGVARCGGVPTFTLNGIPYSTPTFETYSPHERYFTQFANANVRVFGFNANAAACDYGHSRPVWLAADVWDDSGFLERADQVALASESALLLPRINLGTPQWWLEQNHEQLERFEDGSTQPLDTGPTLPPDRAFPSLASGGWRQAIGSALAKLIGRLQESRHAERIFGYVLSGLHTEEFYHWTCGSNQCAGYSPHTVAAFRQFLRRRYRDTGALQSAWRSLDVSFDNAGIPSSRERRAANHSPFRDPAVARNVIDFYQFWNELIPDTIDYFAGFARRATRGRKVIGAFYGYMYEFAGDPEFGHNALGKLVRSKSVDFIAVTASYSHRQAGNGSDYTRSPALSVQLHNKVWYHDNDVVSFRAKEIMERMGFTSDADWTRNLDVQLKSLGYTETAEESRWMYRRGLGMALCRGLHHAWFDLHGGYFDDPKLMAEIKQLNNLITRAVLDDRSSIAEVLVVADELSCMYAAPQSHLLRESLLTPQNQLARMGVATDHVLVDDLDLVDVDRYKMVIFLNAWHLTQRQRQTIRRRVLGNGRYVVCCYATGLFTERGESWKDMQDLLGLQIQQVGEQLVSPRLQSVSGPAPLQKALVRHGPVLEIDRVDRPPAYCHLFAVQDKNAVDLAIQAETNEVVLACAEQSNWHSVYSITAALPAGVWRELARVAGAHVYLESDDALYMNHSFLCLHAKGAGLRKLSFPAPVTLTDPLTGETVLKNESRWEKSLHHGETVILRQSRQHALRPQPAKPDARVSSSSQM